MSLTQLVTPKCALKDLTLPEDVLSSVRNLLEDQEYGDVLAKEGLLVRRRVLLHGPSGCGKTSIAHAIASELQMKLQTVSLAQTIGSHIGESEKNIDSIFALAAQNRCVVLMDEFDSIGSTRMGADDAADLACSRVVNTILTRMESTVPLGLIVACTNFIDQIDPAVRRRFDLTLEIPSVSREGLRQIAQTILKGRFGITPEMVLSEAATPAAVVQYAQDLLRRAVIRREKDLHADTMPLFGDPGLPARKIREKLLKVQETKVAEATA